MNEGLNHGNGREINIIAQQLSEALIRSDEYNIYRQKLTELKEQPELYAQTNNLRRNNFQRQNGGGGRMSHEEYSAFAAESKRLRS